MKLLQRCFVEMELYKVYIYIHIKDCIISGFMLLISDSDPWLSATASAEKGLQIAVSPS